MTDPKRVLVAVLFVAGCGSSPTSPSGETAGFSWTVDGAQFQASGNGRGAGYYSGALIVAGVDCGRGPGLNIQLRQANAPPGTYDIAGGALFAQWTPDGRTGDAASISWQAGLGSALRPNGSGSLTLSAVSDSWIAGSFSFQMFPDVGNQADQSTKTVQGSFSLPLRQSTIC